MGFGYLFLGYLVTFLLHTLASALGVGSLALLMGSLMMWVGVKTLRLYCNAFDMAEWTLYPILALGLYRLIEDLSVLFLWNVPILSRIDPVVSWIEFALIILFHGALLSAVRTIGMQVELRKIETAAIRNTIIVLLYAMTYLFVELLRDPVQKYLILSVTLLNLAWVLCNLGLLLRCAKDIVAEGQEDPQPKRYKWNFLNRIGDRFEENMKKAADSNRDAIEEHLRKKQEKRNASQSTSVPKHSKKKK